MKRRIVTGVVYTLLISGMTIWGSYEFLKGVANEQAMRESARITAQLDKCHGGGFCRVDRYRFLTLSERRLP